MNAEPLALDDIEALAVGAWILGTGGGGGPYLGLLNMRRPLCRGASCPADARPWRLADEEWVAVVSNYGGAASSGKGSGSPGQPQRRPRRRDPRRGCTAGKFGAVMSLEIGGGNGIQPLMAAAHLGLPVVDADTMGRAYPEAQMTSVAVGGLRPYPCALYDPRGIEAVVTKVPDWKSDGAREPQDLQSRWGSGSPRPAKRRAPAARSRNGASTSP